MTDQEIEETREEEPPCTDLAGVAFENRDEHSLKGVADPQRLFAMRGGGG